MEPNAAVTLQMLQTIFESNPMAVTVVDRNGRITVANSSAEKILRLTRTEISQRCYDAPEWTITDLDGNPFPVENLPFVMAKSTLAPVYNVRHAISHNGSERIYLKIDAYPVFDDRSDFDGIIAFIEDISESVRDSIRRKESEATLRSIFRAAPVGIGMVKRRQLLWINEKMQEICGYTEAELINQSARMLYPSDDEFELVGKEKYHQIEQHGTGTVETRWQRKDGQIIEVLLSSAPIDSNDLDKGVTFSVLDISTRIKLEQQLRQSEKMQAIGQLAGGIAHDFNNQLAGIMGFADLLDEALPVNSRLKRYTSEILSSATRASELTFQLLAFAQKGKYLSVSVDIHRVIADVIGLLSHAMPKNIVIEQHLMASPTSVKGDPSQIQNALLNLAINGRNAMPDGGTLSFSTETVEVSRETDFPSTQKISPGKYMKISVTDTGVGVSPDVAGRIFEPFFSGEHDSSGLGLAAVYGTCQNHSGAIDMNSIPDAGSTFSMYLPLETGKEHSVPAPLPRESYSDISQQTVLIVDDEEVVREMLHAIVTSMGYLALECENGVQAVKMYRTHQRPIDLVILDMVMPVKDGRTTFFELREIDPDAKVLISSGYTVDGDAQELLSRGALGFIQKPFRSSAIREKLTSVLTN